MSKDRAAAAEKREPNQASLSRDLRGLGRLWPYLRPKPQLVIIAALLIPIIALLDAALPLILRTTIDRGIIAADVSALGIGAGAYLATVLLGYATRALQAMTSSMAVHEMIRLLRRQLISHVLQLKAAFHDRSMSGALVTRATGDFDNLSESLNLGVLTSVVDLAVLIGLIAGMFLLDLRLAVTALLVLPIVAVAVNLFSRGLKRAMLQARVKVAALNAFIQECFFGHVTIKLLSGETEAARRGEKLGVDFRDAQMSSVVLDATMFAVLDGIASVTVGLALWVAVGTPGDLQSAGVLVAFVQYIQQLFEPLKQLGNKMAMLQGAFASLDRIFGLLEQKGVITGDQAVPELAGAVTFDHVTFSYGKDLPPVLKDVSFTAAAGETLALVGTTGSGKSTVIKLISKLYDGFSGDIRLDDHDLRDLDPAALIKQMAIVPQDIVIFDGTVAFNIGLGAEEVTREQIIHAAQQVGADAFIESLPGGYDHRLREQGANLSQGQRQLIAFARALAKKPRLVILDEATSAVDPASEAAIQRATTAMLGGRTVIVIAHRLATIRQVNKILVIDKGRVIESGSHQQLLAQNGAYRRLHDALASGHL